MASDANWKFVIEGTAVPQQREEWNKFNRYLECFFFRSDQTQPLANNIYIYHFHIGKQYQYLSLSTSLIQRICSWEAASLMEVL